MAEKPRLLQIGNVTDRMAARGILVAHTPDVPNDEVADTAILLRLAVSRHLLPA